MGDFLNSLTGDQKTKLVIEAAKVVPAIIGFNQANKAKNQQAEYLKDIKTAEKNRQRLVNPYAQLSNPYQNMQVATKAAEMQAEQTDLALANTLDSLRKTGAGGATALAQAALKSKQGIAASIEKQETQNARLAAQGQLQVDVTKAQGQQAMMGMQEKREEAQLDRLQGLADLEAMRRQQGLSTGVSSISSMLSGGAKALINPQATALDTDTDATTTLMGTPTTMGPPNLSVPGGVGSNQSATGGSGMGSMSGINSPTPPPNMPEPYPGAIWIPGQGWI